MIDPWDVWTIAFLVFGIVTLVGVIWWVSGDD